MPDMDLTSIIESAVADAEASAEAPEPLAGELGDDIPEDAPEVPEGDEAPETPADEPVEGAEDADEDPETPVPEKEVKEPVKKELSEVEKILEAAGIKAPVPGQKDNKIPYSRTVKIIGNALKKQADTHSTALSTVETRATTAETRARAFEAADRIATDNPDEYMRRLAIINPAYAKFIPGAATAGTEDKAKAAPLAEKAPGPDVKFEDGSFGYSPEQAQKREDWIIATAEERAFNRAKSMYEERFGPIEKAAKTREAAAIANAERLPKIRAEIADQKVVWGDDFPADGTPEQIAVSKLLNETGCSLAVALNKVLLPKVRQSRAQMRADILKEQAKRPAAAARNAPAAKKAVRVDPNAVRDTDAVIRDAIAAAGLEL